MKLKSNDSSCKTASNFYRFQYLFLPGRHVKINITKQYVSKFYRLILALLADKNSSLNNKTRI